MKSTMFLSNLSVVDHAYINPLGNVVGGSFNPSFLVTGETDLVEKVVVDFSTVKKDLKALIDHPATGFDHKLWILPDSAVQMRENADGNVDITTPVLRMNLPSNAIRKFPSTHGEVYNTRAVGRGAVYNTQGVGEVFAQYLQEEMRKKYPGIEIECVNSTDVHSINPDVPCSMFTYTHGLKDSTSWGCQNIAHGHLSYLQLFNRSVEAFPGDRWDLGGPIHELCRGIALHLNGAIFIREENIVVCDDNTYGIHYETARGSFYAEYRRDKNKLIVLETETTVEFLADYILNTFGDRLRAAGVGAFALSEGLTKGAFLKIPNL